MELIKSIWPSLSNGVIYSLIGQFVGEYQDADSAVASLIAEMESLSHIADEEGVDLEDLIADLSCDGSCSDMPCLKHAQKNRMDKLEKIHQAVLMESRLVQAEESGEYTQKSWTTVVQQTAKSADTWKRSYQQADKQMEKPFNPPIGSGKGGGLERANYCRERARDAQDMRMHFLRRAAEAWSKGKVGIGKTEAGGLGGSLEYFRQEARQWEQAASRWNKEAFDTIVAYNDSQCMDGSIDLHNLTVREAHTLLETRLDDWEQSRSNKIRVVTGRGSHSENREARIKPAVIKLLNRRGLRMVVEDGWITVYK